MLEPGPWTMESLGICSCRCHYWGSSGPSVGVERCLASTYGNWTSEEDYEKPIEYQKYMYLLDFSDFHFRSPGVDSKLESFIDYPIQCFVRPKQQSIMKSNSTVHNHDRVQSANQEGDTYLTLIPTCNSNRHMETWRSHSKQAQPWSSRDCEIGGKNRQGRRCTPRNQ